MSDHICAGCKDMYSSCRAYCKKYKFFAACKGYGFNLGSKNLQKEADRYTAESKTKKAVKHRKSQIR